MKTSTWIAFISLTILSLVGCATDAPIDLAQPPSVQSVGTLPDAGAITPTAAPTLSQPTLATSQPAPPARQPAPGNANPALPGTQGGAGAPGVAGTVKTITSNTLLLAEQNGNTVKVQVDDKTTYLKRVAATTSDIQVGVRLAVMGETSGTKIQAQTIQIVAASGTISGMQPGANGAPPAAPGRQPGVNGTPPAAPGASGARPALPNGSQPGQSGNVPAGLLGSAVFGTVKSISGNSIELTGADGKSLSVQLDAKTMIEKESTAAWSDIKTGMQISVMGDTASGTITARVIQIGLNGK